MVRGHPALKFDTGDGWSLSVLYEEYHGAPAFQFNPTGARYKYVPPLYVSKERVAQADPGRTEFDLARTEVQAEWVHEGKVPHVFEKGPVLVLKTPTGNYRYLLFCGRVGLLEPCSDDDDLRVFMLLAISDFDKAVQEFDRITAPLRPGATPAAARTEAPKPASPPAAPPVLALSLQPANVQVYVDDVFKGMTSAEGRLVVEGLAPGTHRVRMNLIGYAEAERTVELKAGETATIEARLEPAGPKPLALAEIEEALANGLPPKGIAKLVNQYGVDFALTKEVEQRLRSKGADSDLLLAIATGKK